MVPIPKIKTIEAIADFKLHIIFDDGFEVEYDVKEDIKNIPAFKDLETQIGLFKAFTVDESRTCVTWTDKIDLPSDTLREFGIPV